MLFSIPFPAIDPVAVAIGPLAIRWYALAYIAGLVLGWLWCRRLLSRPPEVASREALDDFLFWATLGVVLGGRLGYVLFYKPGYYLAHPLEILAVWQGGMAFHGGMLGVILAIILFCRRRGIDMFAFGDIVCCAVPLGLLFGRIANFINGELYGRPSSVAWAMVFPHSDGLPRHPSQLYQALLEGLVLFLVVNAMERMGWRRRPGAVAGIFLAGYGCARIIGELFREPDSHLGYLVFGATMGQLLSLPLIAVGLGLVWRGIRRERATQSAG